MVRSSPSSRSTSGRHPNAADANDVSKQLRRLIEEALAEVEEAA